MYNYSALFSLRVSLQFYSIFSLNFALRISYSNILG